MYIKNNDNNPIPCYNYFMKLMVFLFYLFSFDVGAFNVAIIDTGIDKKEIPTDRFVMDRSFNCPMARNLETGSVCEKEDQNKILHNEFHGTEVAKIIIKNSSVKIADYNYTDINNSMYELYLLKYPKSNYEVWKKKQIYKKIINNLVKAIDNASKLKADIVNISSGDRWFDDPQLYNELKKHQDILFVVSAGNNGQELLQYDKFYPCSFNLDNVICVGATKNNKITGYSNYGTDVTLFVEEDTTLEGTSFVAPKVTRIASRMMAKENKTPKEIKDKLIQISRKVNGIRILKEDWK